MEDAAASVGAQPAPDVLVPGQLSGRPGPCLHRALQQARRRRCRPVQRPRHDAAPGGGRGAHRRRQRPQSVRAPADRIEARARHAGRGGDPADPPQAGIRCPGRGMARARAAGPGRSRIEARRCARGGLGTRSRGCRRSRSDRGRGRLPPAHSRPDAGRPQRTPAGRPRGSIPARGPDRDPARQERELPVRGHAQHVQHGAALRA